MADVPSLNDNPTQLTHQESLWSKLARETQVFGQGALLGAAKAAASPPQECLVEFLGSAVGGYALSALERRAGFWFLGAQILSGSLAISAVNNGLEQGNWVYELWSDTWNHREHQRQNEAKAASMLGKTALDTGLMLLGGSLGAQYGRSKHTRLLPEARETFTVPTTNSLIPTYADMVTYGPKSEVAALLKARMDSVVEVQKLCSTTSTASSVSYASGVIVNKPNMVATSYHVWQGSEKLSVRAPGGHLVGVRMIGFDIDNDLALLMTDEPLGTPVAVPKKAVVQGDVASIGYPGNTRTMHITLGSEGRIGQCSSFLENRRLLKLQDEKLSQMSGETLQRLQGGRPIIDEQARSTVPMAIFNMPSTGGYSGSPVFRREDGLLVGIHCRGSRNGETIAYATPVNKLYELIRRTNEIL